MKAVESEAGAEALFAGEGEMRARCRAFDWAATPLGPVEQWPQSLRTAAGMTLGAGFPCIVLWGRALTQIYNDAYAPIIGAKHPSALGHGNQEVWPEVWHINGPIFERVFRGETVTRANERYPLRRAGPEAPAEDVYLTISYSPVPDESGGVGGVVVTLFDTTAAVASEAASAERERLRAALDVERVRLAEVFRRAPTFLAILRGPEHTFELANDAYYQLVGQHELIGRRVADVFPEVREQGFIALLDDVLATGTPFVGRELPLRLARTPGGEPEQLYVDFIYMPLVEADGTRSGIIAHGTDATAHVLARRQVERLLAESEVARQALQQQNAQLQEQGLELELANQQLQENAAELEAASEELQHSAEELAERSAAAERAAAALAESERQLRTLADAIPTLAWTARADGFLDWYNARWYEYTGTTPEEMAGWGWQAVHDPAVLPTVRERWRAAITTGEPFEMTFPLRGADGRFRPFLTRTSPMRDAAGAVVRWFGTNTDVSPERAAREAAEEAREAAEHANRVKTDFLAAMSHELRTPLNAIAGYAELLTLGIHGPITEAQRGALDRIQRSQRHLLSLINDVLNFAKLEAGQVEFRLATVPVRQVVETLEPLIAPQLEARALHFERDACDDGPLVRADPDKLQQILVNLLSNAIKFTAPGGRVALRCRGAAGVQRIEVADTGIGIAAERLEEIFAPFVQIDRRLHAPREGVGLGLAISRDLARGMGGDLTVASAPGVGSVFTVTLPAEDAGAGGEGAGERGG